MTLLPRNPNAFARSPLDRAGHRRRDQAWLDAAFEGADVQIIPMSGFRPLVIEVGDRAAPGWLDHATATRLAPRGALRLFLGVDAKGGPHFALDAGDGASFAELGRFEDLRMMGARLSSDDLAMIGAAKAVLEWHAKHGFCASCGAASAIVEAGWRRDCPQCKAEHYPRVDPVCIMLPVFGETCLLARQRMWPSGMYSALAGYIEPGEPIEEAVARETMEEAGLRVIEARMHSTQPWPFPYSLMIGVIALVADDKETIDTEELETGRWFSREEAALLIAGKHADAFAPPPFAIAHQLLKTWVEDG
jgi:NAD+ diphosphatase